MATCMYAVDSYCFVIGPCDDGVRSAGAQRCGVTPNIVRTAFYWKFPAAHFWISAIFPLADVTTRAGDFTTFAFPQRVLFFPLFAFLFFFHHFFSPFFFASGTV